MVSQRWSYKKWYSKLLSRHSFSRRRSIAMTNCKFRGPTAVLWIADWFDDGTIDLTLGASASHSNPKKSTCAWSIRSVIQWKLVCRPRFRNWKCRHCCIAFFPSSCASPRVLSFLPNVRPVSKKESTANYPLFICIPRSTPDGVTTNTKMTAMHGGMLKHPIYRPLIPINSTRWLNL